MIVIPPDYVQKEAKEEVLTSIFLPVEAAPDATIASTGGESPLSLLFSFSPEDTFLLGFRERGRGERGKH